MYIEFKLLGDDEVTMLPTHTAVGNLKIIREHMLTWGERHGIPYREKTIKYTHRVTFDQDDSYTFWAMSWNPEQHQILAQYRILSDLNNKI